MVQFVFDFILRFSEELIDEGPKSLVMVLVVLGVLYLVVKAVVTSDTIRNRIFMTDIQENKDIKAKDAEKYIKRYLGMMIVFYLITWILSLAFIVVAIIVMAITNTPDLIYFINLECILQGKNAEKCNGKSRIFPFIWRGRYGSLLCKPIP